jgi:hypothetical protein
MDRIFPPLLSLAKSKDAALDRTQESGFYNLGDDKGLMKDGLFLAFPLDETEPPPLPLGPTQPHLVPIPEGQARSTVLIIRQVQDSPVPPEEEDPGKVGPTWSGIVHFTDSDSERREDEVHMPELRRRVREDLLRRVDTNAELAAHACGSARLS